MEKEQQAKNILAKYNQGHIIKILDKLNEEKKEELIDQIIEMDFEQIIDLYNKYKQDELLVSNKDIKNIKYIDKYGINESEREEYKRIGEKYIKEGKYAVVTMAGGQGTRLGHTGPKGTFKIDTVNGDKYLFEIIVETLKKAEKEYGVVIPWYIMTSKENNAQTVEFLKEKNYFSYPEDKIKIFMQNEIPMISDDGKLIINEKYRIKEASDGNGGIYKSMKENGILDDMESKNIEWIFIGGVDNILLKMVDPILVGATVKENNLVASKSVVKAYPEEKAGVFCKINNRPKVIEYSEMSKEMCEQRDENGELLYGEMNILSHMYNIKALYTLADKKMPYHKAHKKSDYMDENLKMIKVEKPNAFKFEAFIFDGFEEFNEMTILRVKREEEFAPIKNKTGKDSPETAIELYNKMSI